MGVINCAECNGKVSTLASQCPHCGVGSKYFRHYKRSSKDKARGVIFLVVAGFLVVGFVILSGFESPTPTPTPSVASSSSSKSSQIGQLSNEKAAITVSPELVCKAAISLIFGRPVNSIAAVKNGSVVELKYIREVDSSEWRTRCKLEGNEVIWAGFINGNWGRWRVHPSDAKITYRVSADQLMVSEQYPSAKASTKTFDLNSI
jgi:hypothetical protein